MSPFCLLLSLAPSPVPPLVFVEKCKYLEESKCIGICINTCKIPTQLDNLEFKEPICESFGGPGAPSVFNCVVEVPRGSNIKYEIDKASIERRGTAAVTV